MLFIGVSFIRPAPTGKPLAFETLCKALEVALVLSSSQTCRITSPGILAVVTCGYLRRRLRCAPGLRLAPSEVLLAQQQCRCASSHISNSVFAFLSLMDDSAIYYGIVPECSKSPQEIFKDISYTLGPLCLSLAPSSTKTYSPSPSWMAGWTQPQQRLLLNHAETYFDCHSTKGREETCGDDLTQDIHQYLRTEQDSLQVACVFIDEVLEVSGYLPPRRHYDHYDVSGANIIVFEEWFEFVEEQMARSNRRTVKQADVLLQYADTIQARGCNSIWEASPTGVDTSQIVASTRQFLDFITEEDAELTKELQLFYAACYPSHDRCLGVTRKGHFGLLPGGTRRGDGIFVPMGNRVSVVLRRVDAEQYRNMGEAYVHGLMSAEAVRCNTDMEITVLII